MKILDRCKKIVPRPAGWGTIFMFGHTIQRGDSMHIPFGRPEAIAKVFGGKTAPGIFGSVKFYQMAANILVVADIGGLPKSKTDIFALHIHAGGSCQGEGFPNTGVHYDPGEQEHPSHAGDLPPLFSCDGRAFLAVLTNRFAISQVIGKAVVIHSDPDDFTTQPAGNAGQKIACGVISAT